MKLLGLSSGRRMGNSEILLKEALMGAEELGVEVEILRLLDMDIQPCKLCAMNTCPWVMKAPEKCIIKDDAPFLWDKIMECDGLIISAPVYTLTPPGHLKMVFDRGFGPKADVVFKKMEKEQGVDVDERIFKSRVGAFISVGGAKYPNWVSLGLPILHTLTFSFQVAIVDQMQVLRAADEGAVVLDEAALSRARKLGRHVAEAMGKPFEEVEYKGEETGTCPVCHNNLLIVGKETLVECAVCGVKGTIKVEGNKVFVDFPEEEQKKSRLTEEGLRIHVQEIAEVRGAYAPRRHEVPPKLEKYEKYKTPLKPPSKIKQ
ncbi:MAG: flavodoxin family protein [Firmicutes bacterium]|nr:flavodoxin family protein [Bacillota bacterium]